MKKLSILFIYACFLMMLFPIEASADTGPKPSITIYVENIPDSECYLDLLVDYPAVDICENISESEIRNYDQKLIGMLREYEVDGWRPAMVTGTMPPLYGDIECEVTDGKCT